MHGVRAFFNYFNFFKTMRSMNLQFLLNILDSLDIKLWNLEKKLGVRSSILGSITFFTCQKRTSRAFFSR
jgi:hypothetical protein